MGSRSLSRRSNLGPLPWERRVVAPGPPRASLNETLTGKIQSLDLTLKKPTMEEKDVGEKGLSFIFDSS